MPATRALIAFLACTTFAFGADTARLRTLTGNTVEGELVSLSEKEVVLKAKEGNVTTPVAEVLDLEFPGVLGQPTPKYIDVELADGSVLHCTGYTLKGKEVELKLALAQEVKIPLTAVSYFLNDAQEAKVREEWQALLGKKGNRDLIAVKDKEGKVNGLEGTFGDPDDKGEAIEFE